MPLGDPGYRSQKSKWIFNVTKHCVPSSLVIDLTLACIFYLWPTGRQDAFLHTAVWKCASEYELLFRILFWITCQNTILVGSFYYDSVAATDKVEQKKFRVNSRNDFLKDQRSWNMCSTWRWETGTNSSLIFHEEKHHFWVEMVYFW